MPSFILQGLHCMVKCHLKRVQHTSQSSSLVFKMNRPALPKTWKTFLFSALTFQNSFKKKSCFSSGTSAKFFIVLRMRLFEKCCNTVQNSCLKIFLKYFSKYWRIGNLHYSCSTVATFFHGIEKLLPRPYTWCFKITVKASFNITGSGLRWVFNVSIDSMCLELQFSRPRWRWVSAATIASDRYVWSC